MSVTHIYWLELLRMHIAAPLTRHAAKKRPSTFDYHRDEERHVRTSGVTTARSPLECKCLQPLLPWHSKRADDKALLGGSWVFISGAGYKLCPLIWVIIVVTPLITTNCP